MFCKSSSISFFRIKISDDCLVLWNQLNSNSTLQNRWRSKNEILSNILDKYIYIYIYIYIYTLKKSSTLASLLMEKPGKWFAIIKIWEKDLHLYLRFPSGTVFSFCLCKSGFSISRTSTPNGLFQTINELKVLIGYSKWLHQQ